MEREAVRDRRRPEYADRLNAETEISVRSDDDRARLDHDEIRHWRAASGTKTGVPLSDADKAITDIQKAYFAHTGQGPHGTKRPFYQVNEAEGKAVSELCQENLNDLIREENAKNGY